MKKKVSLKDIAQRVGVSIALVSYVLNNKKLNRINKDVAQKIQETARELNYRTNQLAKGLKTNRTQTLGLVVADISNPFSANMARIIEDEAAGFDYTVIFGSSDENPKRCSKILDVLVNHQVDGLIIAPTEHAEEQLLLLQQSEIPFVLIDRYFPGMQASYIAIDNYEASFKLTKHLIEQGRQRIGLINYKSDLVNLKERSRGYTECLEQHHQPIDTSLIQEVSLENTAQQVQEAIQHFLALPQPADAVLFASNTLSLYGLKYINSLNLNVPHHLAIVAFDETDGADLFYAPLTHIKQPLQQMGKLAVETIMKMIDGDKTLVTENMEAGMVIRASSIKGLQD